jgi:hypothetical protein
VALRGAQAPVLRWLDDLGRHGLQEGEMQYHQLRILCALRDKMLEADKTLTRQQVMHKARKRMELMGSGSRELFDLQ